MIQSVRGTNDILPSDSGLWQHIERVFRECSAQFGFQEIRTPIFEHTELFARGIGENTDVVSKEMYTFSDLGNETLTLRPEATAGLIRSAIEHTLVEKNPVVRLWTCGPMFRQERPQKGRYRQFHQFDAELLGSAFPESDVEVISFMYRIIQTIGLTSFEFQINSLGNIQSRIRYREALIRHFEPFAGELSDDSRSRLHRNPLRILDSKHPQDANVIHSAPKLAEFLDDESRAYFDEVQRLLHLCSIPFRVNDRLVRGLDYYCHTTFECVTGKLGSQNALGGGGDMMGFLKCWAVNQHPALVLPSGLNDYYYYYNKKNNNLKQIQTFAIYIVSGWTNNPANKY